MKYLIPYKKIRANAKAPFHAHPDDAGWDLYVSSICPHMDDCLIQFGSGLAFDFSSVGFADARPRSSVWKHGLMLTNSAGVIDAGYRGEVCGVFCRMNDKATIYNVGERFLQLVFPLLNIGDTVEFVEVDCLHSSSRGDGGYGSTGDT